MGRAAALSRAAACSIGAVLVALTPTASAHGGGGESRGYSSTIEAITPDDRVVKAAVLDGDDRIAVTVAPGHSLTIEGYSGEPYLRIDDSGTFENARSPAAHLNDARFGDVDVPGKVDPAAEPEWTHLSKARSYVWHDHRIHWMSRVDPPQVAADPSAAHDIFDWTVPGTLDGAPFEIAGSLGFIPPSGGGFPRLILGVLIALILANLGFFVLRRGRSDPAVAAQLSRETDSSMDSCSR